MNLPQDFTAVSKPITAIDVGEAGKQALDTLTAKSYAVHLGLSTEDFPVLATMTQEPGIREYCPKDATERFTSLESVHQWFAKGRAMFLLVRYEQRGSQLLAGYGWVGAAREQKVPAGQTTFAVRIGALGQGQGLAEPFSQVIIAASRQIFGAHKFWLETWQSNGAAVHIYHKLGFQDVVTVPAERPSLAVGGSVADSRIFMELPELV